METSSKLAESVHGPGLGKQSEVQIMMLSMMMVMMIMKMFMMMVMMIMKMFMMIQTVTIRLQENQNLENGSVGGDEAKLREELAAMTKKATELEVIVTIILINFMCIIIMIAMTRCECEDSRGWVRRPATGTRLLNGRGVKPPGILCQHNHQHRLHHQVLKESTSKVEFWRISITEVGY